MHDTSPRITPNIFTSAAADKIRSAALFYAGRGWPVFPLHSITPEGKCTCGNANCGSPGKHPLTANGVKDATIDERTIEEWWRRHPTANIGIATGGRSGIWVIDLGFVDKR